VVPYLLHDFLLFVGNSEEGFEAVDELRHEEVAEEG
jgi:hypothetical protein